jgi:hypothetical protein
MTHWRRLVSLLGHWRQCEWGRGGGWGRPRAIGAAGTGAAGTGAAGTGAEGTGAEGTGAEGTGTAGTGAEGRGRGLS